MSLLNPETFLDLVQRTSFECGIAGPGPSTLVGATGQNADLFNWVNQAWLEIQSKHPYWLFKRVSPGVSFATVAGQMIYTPTQAGVTVGDVAAWDIGTFRVYKTATGTSSEIFMEFEDYDIWRDCYQIGALRTAQVQPIVFTVLPNRSLGIQCPLAGYTITGDYFSVPTPFTADGDIPSIPKQYIMLIVYEAMKKYAFFESAPDVLNQAKTYADPLMTRLENTNLPPIRTCGAL